MDIPYFGVVDYLKCCFNKNKLPGQKLLDKENSCSKRDNEISKLFFNFPPDLSDIIIGYDSYEFKKTETKFNNVLPKNPKNIVGKCRVVIPFEECDLINTMVRLKNGLIMTANFRGLLSIWEPSSGKCLKKLKSLNNYFLKIDKNPKIYVDIHQINDDMIIVRCKDSQINDIIVFIVEINQDTINKFTDLNENKTNMILSFHHQEHRSKLSNQFITISYQHYYYHVSLWNIDKKNNSVLSHYKKMDCFLVSFLSVHLCDQKLIFFGQNHEKTQGNILVTLDVKTLKKINKLEIDGKVLEKPIIIGTNILISVCNNKTIYHILINIDTFEQTNVFNQINDHIFEAIYLKKDIYLIATHKHSAYWDELPDVEIYIVHLPTQQIIQEVDMNGQSIRNICDYKNGFVTVTSAFEINTYSCV